MGSDPAGTLLVDAAPLRSFCADVARAMGADAEVAAEVARHLVSANLSAHDSHGVLRLAQYVAELDAGHLRPASRAGLVMERPVTAVFDAARGFGHHSTMVAAEWALARAREHGLAAAVVRHSMHIGRLGEYTEALAAGGMIGLVTVGVAGPGSGSAAPFGGLSRFLGTNPWSIGVPAGRRAPMILDCATTTIAEGKARLALARGTEVPPGTVRDTAGRPARNPAALYEGGSLTMLGGDIAGHKGYGLSLASALIGGLAMIGDAEPTPSGCMRLPDVWGTRLAGVFVAAVDPAAFGDAAEYVRRVAGVLDAVAVSPPAPGVDEVLVPGDPERRSRELRSRTGIPLPPATWEELTGIAERFGVDLPMTRSALP